MREAVLQVHPEVGSDLVEISTYIASDNPLAAVLVETAITNTFDLLAHHPRLGSEYSPHRRQ